VFQVFASDALLRLLPLLVVLMMMMMMTMMTMLPPSTHRHCYHFVALELRRKTSCVGALRLSLAATMTTLFFVIFSPDSGMFLRCLE
jgi:hypothetical protein